ncbi:MAG: DNA-3-methyladenine glycosylase I [Pseudomonadota bacterium]
MAKRGAVAGEDGRKRCPWCLGGADYVAYHDEEWGVPVWDDAQLFECLTLESAQAGLSWITILRKREGYRRAFAGFDPLKVARFTPKRVEKLLQDASIVRHRAKIEAAIGNARAFLELQARHGSFADWQWAFVDGEPIRNRWRGLEEVPASTPASDRMAKALKAEGFKFLGTTTVYAHMQATGMVNDHLQSCFRYREVTGREA